MKTFFGSTFVEEELLRDARIDYPIKLQYYKIMNEEETLEGKSKFGIYMVKKEYRKEGTKVEEGEVKEVTDDEKEIEEILKYLKRGQVMPVELEVIVNEYMEINHHFWKNKTKSLQNTRN
ncbi:MAG: hypothetical protein HFJ33_03770 [Clostridia bacterium]|nr:hypothetical protein [Clostridia bacterium]